MLKYISFLCLFFISVILLSIGCSKPILKMPEPIPPIVKQYKHTTVRGNIPWMQNTGVHLEKGDAYTLFARGEIDAWPSNPDKKRGLVFPGHRTIARIGNNPYFRLYHWAFTGEPKIAYDSGKLHLGITDGKRDRYGKPLNPDYFKSNTGSIGVDIIVWEREDYVQIVDFFKKLKKQDPNNKFVDNALAQARKLKEVHLAEVKATEEVEKVEKEIEELKEETEGAKEETIKSAPESKTLPLATTSEVALKKKERMTQLEEKLAQLTATLTQLEEMKKKWEEEKKKTEQLSLELEETAEREQDLLNKLSVGAKAAPVIVVASPSDGVKTESRTIQLTGVAEDDTGISQINITANNKAIKPKDGRGLRVKEMELPKRYYFNERIALDKGLNTIKIRSVDADGLASEVVLRITRIELRRNVWALVVGINEYQNVRNLKYAVNDAQAFYSLLVKQNQIPKENVILLTDQQASLRNLRRALGTQLKKRAGKEDMVIIFFAGHGATEKDASSPDGDGLEKYLLPVDAELEDIYTSAIPMREISHIFRRIKSERIIFIADACYSGASGGRTVNVSGIRSSLSEAFLDRVASGKGTIIITASGANEVSMESEEFKHGIFSYFLLEGLKGKADFDGDGLVTIDELYPYVSDNVARASGQEQHPVKKGTVEGRFVFGVVR